MRNVIIDVLLGLIAGVILGWVVHGIFIDRKVSQLQLQQTQQDAADLAAALKTAKEMQDKGDALQDKINAQDVQYTKQLQDEKNETQTLRDCITNGTCGLRIHATCKADPLHTGAHMSHTATTSRLGDDTGPQLTGDAQQAYYSLRDGLATVTKQLTACQSYVKSIQQK